MTDATFSHTDPAAAAVNRVPQATPGFWLIKLTAVTMGETAADFLAVNLGLGLGATTVLMTAVLAAAMVWQFRQRAYVPLAYWTAVVLISVVGTLITDNMTDALGIPLLYSTIGFTLALAATFALWFASERTLSIHEVFTFRREAFYWLAILFTFALGTAVGDLISEAFGVGFAGTGTLFGLIIASLALGYFALGLDAMWAFWLCYIFTRPLGASIGDFLSQPAEFGGMGLGTTVTSLVFLAIIGATVVTMSRRA
ncbi:MAG: hypothetical protein H6900_05155 [Rhodobacter sp.]|uniref:COG4705 family protein n=1 Tax=Pararhodobacter sp. TaxID=2127056 RepID=UPI001DCE222C|nr:hypothetical protein [Pararhodobacter sp.]MCB1344782.1 hypothetical protein [Paracoccaceae bacterium]MCC0072658.1 hypothetical protein [Rhodobacter sp.]HPD93216.1 hypothetical protein [Pararhodobacter sp.]